MSIILERVKLQGYRSCILGISVNSNWHLPWPKTQEFVAWIDGWNLAYKDIQQHDILESS